MGKLHQEQMNDFPRAETYYLKALAGNPDDLNVCMAYIHLLIIIKEYDKAQKLISYASGLKGVDLSKTYSFQALIHESKRDYEQALVLFKKARFEAYNEDGMAHINNEIKRVKMKRKYAEKANAKKEEKKA